MFCVFNFGLNPIELISCTFFEYCNSKQLFGYADTKASLELLAWSCHKKVQVSNIIM